MYDSFDAIKNWFIKGYGEKGIGKSNTVDFPVLIDIRSSLNPFLITLTLFSLFTNAFNFEN
ncbi:hypothetical protein AYB33_16770 [Leptospira santarosai]|nr:hypothetical protein AYB33_16770 [Leptospira santarosai]